MIRLIKKDDIDSLAKIYKDLYDNVDIGETWSIEKAKEILVNCVGAHHGNGVYNIN